MSQGWTGIAYTSPTISATSATGSGWLDWSKIIKPGPAIGSVLERAFLRLVPVGVAGAETLAVTYETAWGDAGDGGIDLHVFTTVTSSNASESLILPGGESANVLVVSGDLVAAPVPRFFRLSWVVVGTPSATFVLRAAAILT